MKLTKIDLINILAFAGLIAFFYPTRTQFSIVEMFSQGLIERPEEIAFRHHKD